MPSNMDGSTRPLPQIIFTMQSIPTILTLPEGCPIDSIQAKVIGVFPRKEGIGKGGAPWSIQDAELADGGGNKLKIKVWNHPDISTYKGRDVIINSGKDGSIKVLHDTYKGNMTVKAELSKFATFQFLEVWNAQTNGQASAPTNTTIDVGAGVKVEVKGDPAKASVEQALDAKKTISRQANLWLACYEAALYCNSTIEAATGNPLTHDQFQSCVASIFIQSTKDGAVMPAGKYEMKKHEASAEKEPF